MAAIGMPKEVEENPILKAAQQATRDYINYTNRVAKQQESLVPEENAATQAVKSALETQIQSKQIIEKQKAISELTTQNKTIDAFEAAGGAEFLTSLMSELKDSTKEMLSAQEKVDKIREDSPEGLIGFIAQQFKLLTPETELANAETKTQNITQSISNITSAQESIQRAIATTKKTVNTATIEAQQRELQAIGAQELSKVELESIARNASQLEAIMRASGQQLQAKLEEYKLRNTEENQIQRRAEHELSVQSLEFQLEKFKDSRDKAAIDLESAKLALEEAKDPKRRAALQATFNTKIREFEDTEKFQAIATSSVNKSQAMLGLPIEDKVNVMWGLTQPGDTGKKYKLLLQMGTGDKDKLVLGNTPAEAAQNLLIAAPEGVELTPPIRALAIVQAAQNEKYKDPASGGIPREKEIQIADFNKTAREVFTRFSTNIKTGDTSNLYHAPPMPVIEEMDAIKTSKFYQQVLAPLAMKEFSPKGILQATSAAIGVGTVSIENASIGLHDLFKAIAAYNNEHWNFKRVGLPEQTSYKTSVVSVGDFSPGLSIPTIFSSYEEPVIDMLDPIQVKRAVLESISRVRQPVFNGGTK